MRQFKAALVAVAVLASTGLVARAELSMAQSGSVMMDEAYAQMGGLPFRVTDLPAHPAKKA
ncbi:hypothetical protein [Methylobacterium nigriterrae]|uniref:hypothetical protein n=1 Tax=Methylobacterium nigriterrae TaxID=3127512 RepID=UPI0030137424